MILDFSKNSGAYILHVNRSEADIVQLMREHGLDMSEPDSTHDTAVLFTRQKYAAMAFAMNGDATPEALVRLAPDLAQIHKSWQRTSDAHIQTPDDKELWPFQKAGVSYCLERLQDGGRALIGDQPGLGKTPQGVCIANELEAQRVLVVCPANIRLQWAKEIRRWTTLRKRPIIYPILKSSDGVHPRAHYTIVSYNLTNSKPILECLMQSKYDLIILDEAHYLKTSTTARTRNTLSENGLSSRSDAVVALTGTPLPNRPRECYTLARGLCFDAIDWMSEEKFQDRYNPRARMRGRGGGEYTREEVGRLPELQARLRSNFMVRRMKRDVLDQLPEVRYDIVHVEETGAVQKALEAESMLEIDPEDLSGIDREMLGHVSVVRREMGIAKAPQVADYVSTQIDGGEEKIVLFGWHIHVLDILQQKLGKYGVVRVDGRTSPARKQLAVELFQQPDGPRIFLGNLQSVGVGVDGLQNVCSRAIFAECSWTPSDNEQGVGRLERIGQNTGILAEFLVAPSSFDERVLGSSLRKMRNIHSALDKETL